tara:strand:- start:504 stop:1991 length:1488 start_codon:yes stop_codon:yes gene_type:complete
MNQSNFSFIKNPFTAVLFVICCIILFSCGNASDKSKVASEGTSSDSTFSALAQQSMQPTDADFFTITLTPEPINYYMPALHSFTKAVYNELWIIIGGQTTGFHGTSNSPKPFLSSVANDSLWVIDPIQGASYGIPIPKEYWNALSASNSQSYQVGNDFYVCGGYTVSDQNQTQFNTTSNYFFKINLQNLVSYVKSGGSSPSLSEVFPIAINNDFVRVTGGQLMVVNNNFYLIGGQDYEGTYSTGLTGKYTNSIRSFTLEQSGETWSITNKDSLVDPVNLHRRDFNLVPFITADKSLDAIIYGGVFTTSDLSYNNPIYIKGLSAGKPTISIGLFEQRCNQYTTAVLPIYSGPDETIRYAMLGGISYMKYDSDSGKLVIGDSIGSQNIPMPFSNLVSFMETDGISSIEQDQIPPLPLLPKYLGSNASFIPSQQYTVDGFETFLDLDKILLNHPSEMKVGYMYGGILSDGPTSGTTPNGYVNTYANPVLYSVNFRFDN